MAEVTPMNGKPTVDSIVAGVHKQVEAEITAELSKKYHAKFKEFKNAERLAANLKRELDEIKLEIADELAI